MKNIRLVRLLKNLSQWEIARLTGISQCRISLVERGYIALDETEVKKIAQVLRVEVSDIFDPDRRVKDYGAPG